MKEVIKKLSKSFEDEDYKHGWIANIAMAQIDSEHFYRVKHNKVGKYLNRVDRHTIANEGAERFINLLTKVQE